MSKTIEYIRVELRPWLGRRTGDLIGLHLRVQVGDQLLQHQMVMGPDDFVPLLDDACAP